MESFWDDATYRWIKTEFLCAACRAKQNGSCTSRSSRKCGMRRPSLADRSRSNAASNSTGTTPTTTALTSMTRPANPTLIISRWVLALSNESAAHYRRTFERMTSESARHCAQCRIPLFEAKVRWQGRLISWRFFFCVKCWLWGFSVDDEAVVGLELLHRTQQQ